MAARGDLAELAAYVAAEIREDDVLKAIGRLEERSLTDAAAREGS